MSGESHTVRMNIDGSGAKRGAAAYAAAIDKIKLATVGLNKSMAEASNAMAKNSFAKIAKDLAVLTGIRINPNLAKNLNALSAAISGMRGPSAASVRNTSQFLRALSRMQVSSSSAKNLGAISAALAGFHGPNRASVNSLTAFFKTLNSARLTGNIGQQLAAVSAAINNFKGPSPQAIRNVQALSQALNMIRVPPGLSQVGTAINNLNRTMGRSSSGILRFGGSVNGIPWGRASAGAIQLTGNLRGLENAMSLSYQMGSQLRTLFGALTVSGFTSSVVEATTATDRLRVVLGSLGHDQETVNEQMEFATAVAGKYGVSLLQTQREFGKFAASLGLAGTTVEETQFVFESLAASMRLFGLDSMQQTLAIKAVTQMFQKGTIQAEEFKNQFGDQMPAAFEALRRTLVRLTGDKNADPMKMMKDGEIPARVMIDVMQEMNDMFGKGYAAAADMAIASTQRLQNAWTKFVTIVGSNGVMDAIGDVADKLTEIMESADFQAVAKDIAEGLANAIRKVGDAAAFLLTHIRQVGQVIAIALGAKALMTAVQIGSAFGLIGTMVAQAGGAVMGFGRSLLTIGRGATVFGALTGAIGAVGGAFGIAAVVGAGALALLWDKTIELNGATATVGEMAQIAFQDFAAWAQYAGSVVYDTFINLGAVVGEWFNAMNQSVTGGAATWEDWAKAVIFSVTLVGKTMVGVFVAAWKILASIAKAIGRAFGSALGGVIGSVAALGDALSGNFAEAGRKMSVVADTFGQAWNDSLADFSDAGATIGNVVADAAIETKAFTEGVDWLTQSWDGSKEAAVDYFSTLAARAEEAKKKLAETAITPDTFKGPQTPDGYKPTDLSNSTKDAEKNLSALGKTIKDTAEAIEVFKKNQADLDKALASGAINARQYADAMNFYKGALEEVADPYAAMVRSMQEENNMLRLNGREQRKAQDFLNKKNELLEKGVVMTDAQTASLKELIAIQDELNNPRPLQAWIDGMEDFGDAVESAGVKAMEGLSDALADFIVDGKADWEGLFKSILKDLIKLSLNEVWKSLFGGDKTQLTVNAPLAKGLDMTPGGNQTIMALAVAQGISMAGGLGGGGLSGLGSLGNDIGAGPSSTGLGALLGGYDDIGTGAGSWADFQKLFGGGSTPSANVLGNDIGSIGGGIPLPRVRPDILADRPQWEQDFTTAVTDFGESTTQLGDGLNQIGSSYKGFNDWMQSGFGGLFGGSQQKADMASAVETGVTGAFDSIGNGPGSFGDLLSMSGQGLVPQSQLGVDWGAMSGGNMLNLSSRDVDLMARVAGTEWNPGSGTGQLHGILDTMMNRSMTPGNEYGQMGGMEGVLNKRWAFSAINAPKGKGLVGMYGNAANAPLKPEVAALTQQYLSQRANGLPSSVGNSTHYLNPAYSSQNSLKTWGNDVISQAGQTGYQFGTGQNAHMHGIAPGAGSPSPYSIGGQIAPQPMMPPGTGGMMQGQQAGFGSMINQGGMSSGGGFSSLPGGMSSTGGTGTGGMGEGMGAGMGGMGESFTAEMQGSFSELSQAFPEKMEPGVEKTGDLLPKKMAEGDGMGEQFSTAMQPAAQQSAQQFQQAFSQVIQQLAQEMQQAMSQAIQQASMSGGGGMGGMMGGMGGLFGMMRSGGIVGSPGAVTRAHPSAFAGAPSFKMGGLIDDPNARPIIAHKGEMVVPAQQVAAMRRMGSKAAFMDNEAVNASARHTARSAESIDAMRSYFATGSRSESGGAARPVITNNWTINTPDAGSFMASKKQIEAKQGASMWRNARRNN